MKPKTKLQQYVSELSSQLPALTPAQIRWAEHSCTEHIAKCTKEGKWSCLECGHSWEDRAHKGLSIRCPNCGMMLQRKDGRKEVFKEEKCLCYVTTFKGWQVLRYVYLKHSSRRGDASYYFHAEVIQHWLDEQGRHIVMALPSTMNTWNASWCFDREMEIRKSSLRYDVHVHHIYPHYRVLPIIKRNGFCGKWYDPSPLPLLQGVLTNPKIETLLKAGQYEMLRYALNTNSYFLNDMWPSIRICIRHGYIIQEPSLWCDLLRALSGLGKDIRNPKYICLDEIEEAHDFYVERLRRMHHEVVHRELTRIKLLNQQEEEEAFLKDKEVYLGLQFGNGHIQVHALNSVREYIAEGEAMHHCVYASSYHLRPDSLVLSAEKDGKRLETVEVSLSTMSVVQSRGACNTKTEYHEEIVQLVNENMHLIYERSISQQVI